jgi:hypothetical protein
MATIHPPTNGHSNNAEEQAANTWPLFEHPKALTPAQLDELRAKAPQVEPDHNSRAAVDIADRQARQKLQDDKRRAEIAAKK